MIKKLEPSDLPLAARVIRAGCAGVAKDFGLTEQNCPGHTAFSTTAERLLTQHGWGWLMYGLFENGRLIGYVSVSNESDGVYEIHNLTVLPESRHKGYGKRLLDLCKAVIGEKGGRKIVLGIIEENTVLKNWYAANGFVHTGTKKFERFPFLCGYMEWEAEQWV